MVDYGLFASIALSAGGVWLATRVWWDRSTGGRSPADQLTAPIFVGMVVGRAVTLIIGDPAGLVNLREFLTIRGGLEFWPAAAAGVLVLVGLFSRPDDPPQEQRVAALIPFALVALAGFQATCVVRDGCAGPASPIGLVPPGLTTRQLPVGLLAGLLLLAFARWFRASPLPAHTKILIGVFGVGAERSLLGVIEPSLDSALSKDGYAMLAAFAVTIGWCFSFERRERVWRQHVPSAPA